MIKFEKISFEQFAKDVMDLCPSLAWNEIREAYNRVKLPKRSTSGSAGYDFYAPYAFTVTDQPVLIPTGIRVKLPENYFLMTVPRSGLGFKTGMKLANTIGIIDPDYFMSDNEGHIKAKILPGFKELYVAAGDRFMQGIIIPFAITDNDDSLAKRTGGFGSTGK